MGDKVDEYARLVEHIIKKNADILDSTQLKVSINRNRDTLPEISRIKIDEKLSISTDLDDSPEAMQAFSLFLESIHEFLEMILGSGEALTRIKGPAEEFEDGAWKETLAGSLPDLLVEKKRIERKSEEEETIEIFEELFTSIAENLKLDIRQVGSTEWFDLKLDGGKAKLSQKEKDGFFGAVIEAFDYWIYDSTRINEAKPTVEAIIAKFEDYEIFPYIRENILRGALAKRVKWGIDVIDGKAENQLPISGSIFFSSPHCSEKEIIVYQMLKEALIQGKGVLVTLTNISPQEFYRILESLGIDPQPHRESLIIIDWYTYSERRVVNIEEEENIIVAASDMTNLGIAMDMGIRRLKETSNKLAIVDFLSPLIKLDGFDGAYNFTQFLRSKLRENGFTSLFLLDSDMHPVEERSAMEMLFDSSVGITDFDDRREFRIDFMGNEKIETSYDLTWEEGNLVIKEAAGLEMTTVLLNRSAPRFDLAIDNFGVIGDIRVGDIVLLEGPFGPESEALSSQFMKQGIEKGNGAIITLSNTSPETLIKNLALGKADKSKTLFVDWNSFKNEWIQGVDESNNIIKVAEDLTYLGVGIEKAIKTVKSQKQAIAAIDVLSPALKSFDFNQTYAFSRAMRSKLKRSGITTLLYVDSEMHEPDILAGIRLLADTIIVISNRAKKRIGTSLISMKMSRFGLMSGGYYSATSDSSKLKIGDKKMSHAGKEMKEEQKPELIQDEALIDWRDKLYQKEKTLKRREERILFREEKVNAREEEFKTRIKAFQGEIEKKIQESMEMESIKKKLMKEEAKLREERAEIKKLWDALAHKEKMVNKN